MATPLAPPYDKLITTSKILCKVKRFWKRRLEIQLSHVNSLNALLADTDIAAHEGNLGTAMGCAKEMLREEVEHQLLAVQRLTSAYEVIENLYPSGNNVPPSQCYLVQHAQALWLGNKELTKQRAGVEADAEVAEFLSFQTDYPLNDPGSPSGPRFDLPFLRLLPLRRRSTNVRLSPDSFHRADMNYRDACTKYNVRRQEILNEVEGVVEASVRFHYDFIEATRAIITAFADAQIDFAEFLGRSYTLLTSMNINTSLPDSNRFRVELRSSIGNQFGLPHQYKNFEFSGWKAPIILFSCPVASEPLQDDSPAACAVHAFYVLAEHTHSLSTPPRNGESEELLRKAVHILETHWDPGDRNGGPYIQTMLENPGPEVSNGSLLIHFLRRLPESLIPMQELDKHSGLWGPDPWDGKNLKRLTSACNRPWVGSCRRRMLVTLGRLLAQINAGDPKKWWTWWNTGDHAAYWSEILTRRGDVIAHLLPWWLFSITLKGTSIEVEDVKVNALRLTNLKKPL